MFELSSAAKVGSNDASFTAKITRQHGGTEIISWQDCFAFFSLGAGKVRVV